MHWYVITSSILLLQNYKCLLLYQSIIGLVLFLLLLPFLFLLFLLLLLFCVCSTVFYILNRQVDLQTHWVWCPSWWDSVILPLEASLMFSDCGLCVVVFSAYGSDAAKWVELQTSASVRYTLSLLKTIFLSPFGFVFQGSLQSTGFINLLFTNVRCFFCHLEFGLWKSDK